MEIPRPQGGEADALGSADILHACRAFPERKVVEPEQQCADFRRFRHRKVEILPFAEHPAGKQLPIYDGSVRRRDAKGGRLPKGQKRLPCAMLFYRGHGTFLPVQPAFLHPRRGRHCC